MSEHTPTNSRLERLLQIAEEVKLHALPFDMSVYFDNDQTPLSCNTPACIAGWACRDTEFQNAGLGIDVPIRYTGLSVYLSKRTVPAYKSRIGGEALAAFFALSQDETSYIFYPRSYNDEAPIDAVIAHIKDVIDGPEDTSPPD